MRENGQDGEIDSEEKQRATLPRDSQLQHKRACRQLEVSNEVN